MILILIILIGVVAYQAGKNKILVKTLPANQRPTSINWVGFFKTGCLGYLGGLGYMLFYVGLIFSAHAGQISEPAAWFLGLLSIVLPIIYIYSPNRISLKGK